LAQLQFEAFVSDGIDMGCRFSFEKGGSWLEGEGGSRGPRGPGKGDWKWKCKSW